MNHHFYVPCTLGLESVLAQELTQLKLGNVEEVRGGATFLGDMHSGYLACLHLRSAVRVQQELARTRIRNEDDLYRFVRAGDWSRYLTPKHTLAVHASLKDAPLTHTGYAAQKVKDAIVDWWRDRAGTRPDVDKDSPDVPIRVVIQGDLAILYRDLAGESLHKRGYRPAQVKSPLNEATAAGILALGGWSGETPITDPMCGSGTFLIEGALKAIGRAPGRGRRFPFETWPDFKPEVYDQLLLEANAAEKRDLPYTFDGADRHRGAIGLAAKCAKEAGVAQFIRFTHSEVKDFQPEHQPKTVFVNPPYGIRLDDDGDPSESWSDLGQFLKAKCPEAEAFVLCGDSTLSRNLRLKALKRFPLHTGPIECRLLHYQILKRRDPMVTGLTPNEAIEPEVSGDSIQP
jgi:putative N6-adenine-specific DNA methylase